VERGTPQQVADQVTSSLEIMKGKPGFILSPVDNVREWSPEIERNVRTLIAAWQGERGSSPPCILFLVMAALTFVQWSV